MKKSVDLCIVGASGAGMAAAVTAAQQGVKNILILEKMNAPGGCMVMAAGLMAIDSPLQRAFGHEYSVDEAFKDLMKVLNWRCDTKLVRKWLDATGGTIAWLDELGMKFDYVTTDSSDCSKVRNTHHRMGKWDEESGEWKMKHMGPVLNKGFKEACKKYGVNILTKTRAKHLTKDDGGRVTGVVAEGPDGELTVTAKAVILATGSISTNDDLVRRFYGTDEYKDIQVCARMPHNTGDGLIMAEEAGAEVGKFGTLFIGPHNHYKGASEIVGMLMRRPNPIRLTSFGERFIDESLVFEEEFSWFSCAKIDALPGKQCYILMDHDFIEQVQNGTEAIAPQIDDASQVHRPSRGLPIFGVAEIEKGKEYSKWRERIIDNFLFEQERGVAKICETLDEVAAFIGCDLETLKKTVDHYNTSCARGHDDEFLKAKAYLQPVKRPPYYVILGKSGIDTFLGGVTVDNHQRVMTPDGGVIPGLYGAGVMCSGWFNNLYAYWGSEMSFTLFSGRNAAKEVASHIEEKQGGSL